nr:repressible high-affinity phosphate permease [Quercus suber]
MLDKASPLSLFAIQLLVLESQVQSSLHQALAHSSWQSSTDCHLFALSLPLGNRPLTATSSPSPCQDDRSMATRTAGGNAAFHNFHNDYAHIADPNERRRLALAEIDKAPFGWYHVRAIAVAGIGFFTDAYDIFAIGLVTTMLGIVYWHDATVKPGTIPPNADTAIKVATSGGTVIGQVGFGALADIVGRKRMYGLELILIIFATLAQSLSSDSPGMSIVGVIIFWRVLMGVGIGGDYPLSSIITSEFATTKWRGAMMGSVFAMQGLGQFGAGIIALIVTTGFKGSLETALKVGTTTAQANCGGVCGIAVDKMWRVIIGFGAVPGCIALYYRLTIPETPRYTFDVSRDVVKGGSDVKAYLAGSPEGVPDEISRVQAMRESAPQMAIPQASFKDFIAHYSQWKYGKVLLGTAGSWFFLDVAFYGIGLNNSTILMAIGYAGGNNMYEVFYNISVGNLILVCAGAIPGYWVTVALVDTIGRKPIQLFGFAILTVLLCIMGFAYGPIGEKGLLACYVLTQFFFNFGPNATTFIVPGECFPTRYRSTSHGLSAASGKVGAIIAQVLIGPLRTRGANTAVPTSNQSPWLNHVLEIFALFMLLGCFTTLLIPETKRLTLEQLAGEVPGTPQYDPRLSGRGVQHHDSDEPSSNGEKGEMV